MNANLNILVCLLRFSQPCKVWVLCIFLFFFLLFLPVPLPSFSSPLFLLPSFPPFPFSPFCSLFPPTSPGVPFGRACLRTRACARAHTHTLSCNFLCVVLAAAYLKYRRCRLSCLPFVWHLFFILTHTHTHTHRTIGKSFPLVRDSRVTSKQNDDHVAARRKQHVRDRGTRPLRKTGGEYLSKTRLFFVAKAE